MAGILEMPEGRVRHWSWRTAACAVMAAVLAASAWGQQPAGSISGRVLDPSGAVIPNASVSLTSAQGTTRTVSSDAQGHYALRQVAPGRYSVVAQAPGFAVFRKLGIQIAAGRAVTLGISLSISATQAQVEVRANPVQVSVSPMENASAVSISGPSLKSLADDPDALLNQIEELAGPSSGPNPVE